MKIINEAEIGTNCSEHRKECLTEVWEDVGAELIKTKTLKKFPKKHLTNWSESDIIEKLLKSAAASDFKKL